MLALPLIRAVAVISGYVWIALAPARFAGWDGLDTAMLGFLVYSTMVIGLLWAWPRTMLRLDFLVLLIDLGFALALIRLSGGAGSSLAMALLLIAGLQSYYYGMRRGVLVAAGASLAYIGTAWPIPSEAWADLAIRITVLIGASIGVGLIAEVEDTERLKVARLSSAAREREQFIGSVLEGLREGVVALDLDGCIVACNQALARRYELPVTAVVGRNFFECFPDAGREPWGDSVRRLLRGELEEFSHEAVERQTRRQGRLVQNIKGGLLRQHGHPAGAVLLVEDITERVHLQDAARQSEKLAALGTLAAGLAHELNNPIGIISSRIELMLLEADPASLPGWMREDLGVLQRHARRVAKIVQGLLSFARVSGGGEEAVDLNQVVDETLLLFEKQVAKDGIALRRRLTPSLPPIQGNPTALQQVLLNLVVNAREAMTGGGEIVVETGPAPERPDQVRLIVRDSGPGMPPEVIARIFDPFFTTKPSGTGLGLSISYGIVRDHRGTVDVESSPGQGTTFTLAFPASPAEVTA